MMKDESVPKKGLKGHIERRRPVGNPEKDGSVLWTGILREC